MMVSWWILHWGKVGDLIKNLPFNVNCVTPPLYRTSENAALGNLVSGSPITDIMKRLVLATTFPAMSPS